MATGLALGFPCSDHRQWRLRTQACSQTGGAAVPDKMATGSPVHLTVWPVLALLALAPTQGTRVRFSRNALRGVTVVPVLGRWGDLATADCAIACARLTPCRAFSVGSEGTNCTLYDSRVTAQVISPAPGAGQEQSFFVSRPAVCPVAQGYAVLPGTDKCVRFEGSRQTWSSAQASCEAEGGQLLTIGDLHTWAAVRAFLEEEHQTNVGVYVGGVRQGSGAWVWLDGTAVGGALWHPGQPDGEALAFCLQVWWRQRGSSFPLLEDAQCTWNKTSVCEV